MFLFGVTGGIGSGKTMVCKSLRKKKVSIINSDNAAKDLINNHPSIQKKLIKSFGQNIYSAPNQINIRRMSQLIFENTDAKERIDAIVHPLVFEYVKDEATKRQSSTSLLGVEAALIFESRMNEILNAVVVVNAPYTNKIQWLQQRSNLTHEEIKKRMQAQMPVEKKIHMADYVINNDSDLSSLNRKVENLYHWLLEKSSA